MGTFLSPGCDEGTHFCDGLCDKDEFYNHLDDQPMHCECTCHLIKTENTHPPIPTRNLAEPSAPPASGTEKQENISEAKQYVKEVGEKAALAAPTPLPESRPEAQWLPCGFGCVQGGEYSPVCLYHKATHRLAHYLKWALDYIGDGELEVLQGPYIEFRKDGWPLCPICGEDELWSASLTPTIENITRCLRCNWKPAEKIR